MTGKENSLTDDLEAAYDEVTMFDDDDAASDLKEATKKKSYADDLGEAYDDLAAKATGNAGANDFYSPEEVESLAAQGMTPSDHARMMRVVSHAVDQSPEAWVQAMQNYRAVGGMHPAHHLFYQSEIQRFTQTHNVSDAQWGRMGQFLQENPKAGERTEAALARAFKATKPARKSKPMEQWRHGLEDAYDEAR